MKLINRMWSSRESLTPRTNQKLFLHKPSAAKREQLRRSRWVQHWLHWMAPSTNTCCLFSVQNRTRWCRRNPSRTENYNPIRWRSDRSRQGVGWGNPGSYHHSHISISHLTIVIDILGSNSHESRHDRRENRNPTADPVSWTCSSERFVLSLQI